MAAGRRPSRVIQDIPPQTAVGRGRLPESRLWTEQNFSCFMVSNAILISAKTDVLNISANAYAELLSMQNARIHNVF